MKCVTIIGTGNVGTHLYDVFTNHNVRVEAVWTRSGRAGGSNPSAFVSGFDFSQYESDIFIVALPDDVIQQTVTTFTFPEDAIIAHTSGSVSMEVLKGVTNHYGIFYPLQTFTKGRPVDFERIPMLLEASDDTTLTELELLANIISNNVQHCDSEKRAQIHLSAVFACNFANRILAISEELLKEKQLDLSLLQPLVEETLKKSFELGPVAAQTGPAKRGDTATMEKHLKMLEHNADYRALYQHISELIQK